MNLNINIKIPETGLGEPLVNIERAESNHCHAQETRFRPLSLHAEIVTDETTGLMWDARGSDERVTFEQAQAYAKSLTLGRFTDWRLPTIQELLTLVDYSRSDPAIDTAAFPNCKSIYYWSSSPVAASADCAWLVGFCYGLSDWNHRGYDSACVRAVRASQ